MSEIRVFIRDWKGDFPGVNGACFLLVDRETNDLLQMDNVLYNGWAPVGGPKNLGRYAVIGYEDELPHTPEGEDTWREITVEAVIIYPEGGKEYYLLGNPPAA